MGALVIGSACSSCGNADQVGKQQLYNNATLVDSEGYTFFKTTYGKAAYELAHAQYVLGQGVSADAKAIADQVVATYTALLPELEQLAADKQVVVPDPGALIFIAPEATAPEDSVGVRFDAASYVLQVQKAHKELIDQFKRVSRNTDKDLRQFGSEKMAAIKEIYTLAGGHGDEGAHH